MAAGPAVKEPWRRRSARAEPLGRGGAGMGLWAGPEDVGVAAAALSGAGGVGKEREGRKEGEREGGQRRCWIVTGKIA